MKEFKTIRFHCDYCKKNFSTKRYAMKHENQCPYNPSNKACATCKNYSYSYAKRDCDVPRKTTFYEYNCPIWVQCVPLRTKPFSMMDDIIVKTAKKVKQPELPSKIFVSSLDGFLNSQFTDNVSACARGDSIYTANVQWTLVSKRGDTLHV